MANNNTKGYCGCFTLLIFVVIILICIYPDKKSPTTNNENEDNKENKENSFLTNTTNPKNDTSNSDNQELNSSNSHDDKTNNTDENNVLQSKQEENNLVQNHDITNLTNNKTLEDNNNTETLRNIIINQRNTAIQNLNTTSEQNIDIWNEDLYCNQLVNSLFGFVINDNITKYLNNYQFSYLDKFKFQATISDDLLEIPFKSPITFFNCNQCYVIIDKDLSIHGVETYWIHKNHKEALLKFNQIRRHLISLLKIPREQLNNNEKKSLCILTYTYKQNENHIILLYLNNNNIKLLLLSTSLKIKNFFDKNINELKITDDNPIVQAFTKAQKTIFDENYNKNSSNSTPGKHVIVGGPHLACKSKELYNKLLQLSIDHDDTAFNTLYAEGLLSGNCVLLKTGEQVFIKNSFSGIFTGIIKIQRMADLEEYWIKSEAIK